MKSKLTAHLVTLPRWFASPAAIAAVLVGVALGGSWNWLSAVAVLAGLFVMAGAHSWNSFLDKEWTHFDEGLLEDRSKEKAYTKGQNVIVAGILSSRAVLINALLWYCASAIFVGIIAWKTSPIIWAIWGAVALCTFWYSWGKLHYQCELALGFGFGPLAVMLGMATQPNPDFLRAFLAGLPFLVLWGWAAEFVDQATDAEPNWPRGLRNLGAIAWRTGVSIPMMTAWLFAVSYLVQFALVMLDVIPAMSLLSLFAIPFMAYGVVLYGETDKFRKVGVLLLLSAILLHMIAFVVGLVLS